MSIGRTASHFMIETCSNGILRTPCKTLFVFARGQIIMEQDTSRSLSFSCKTVVPVILSVLDDRDAYSPITRNGTGLAYASPIVCSVCIGTMVYGEIVLSNRGGARCFSYFFLKKLFCRLASNYTNIGYREKLETCRNLSQRKLRPRCSEISRLRTTSGSPD